VRKRWKAYRPILWLLLGTLAVLLRFLLSFMPEVAQTVYSSGLFRLVRWVYDYTLGWLPFPTVFLLIAILLFLLVRRIRKKKWQHLSRGKRWIKRGIGTLNILGFVVFWFLFLWGFNYARPALEDQLQLSIQLPNGNAIQTEASALALQGMAERSKFMSNDTSLITDQDLPEDLEAYMRNALADVLDAWELPTPGRPRCRLVQPKGTLLKLGIHGIYLPFTAEAHVDASLPPFILPFTIAHELAHSYGFTDEGTANFLAWVACQSSEDPLVQYSGTYCYFQYIRGELRRDNPEAYEQFMATLPQGIQTDREAHIANAKLYSSLFPDLTSAMNDAYLKTQGVEEGVRSYNRMVELVYSYKKNKN